MKIIILFFYISTLLLSNTKLVKVGVLVNKNGNQDFFNLTSKVIEKNFNLENKEFQTKLTLYTNKNKIIKDFSEKKIVQMTISPVVYFSNKQHIENRYSSKWIIRMKKDKLEQFYLISNSKGKNVLQNIKNNNYHVYTWNGIYNSFLWYKYFYYKTYKKSFSLNKNKHTLLSKENKIMYNVFFNKNNIGIISKNTYDTMTELNPQLKKGLKIIRKSKPIFITFLGFNHIDIDKKLVKAQKIFLGKLRNILGNSKLSSKTTMYADQKPIDKELNDFYVFYKELIKLEKKYK